MNRKPLDCGPPTHVHAESNSLSVNYGRLWAMKYVFIIFLFFTDSTLFASSCPYCGRTYISGSRSGADSSYIQSIRTSHEATCSSRNKTTTIYVDDLTNNRSHINHLQQQINRSLTEVNTMVSQLSAGSKQLFSQFTPEERSNLQKAMNAILEDYFRFRRDNTSLNSTVSTMRRRLSELETKLQSSETRSDYLIREIGESSEQLADLRNREVTLKAELPTSVVALEALKEKLQSQKEATEKSRKEYWNELADFVTRHKLGTPRQYMKAISARNSYATRGVVFVDNSYVQSYAVAVPVRSAIPVRVVRAAMIATSVRAVSAAPKLSSAEFERVLSQTKSEINESYQLRSWVSGLLIDTEKAQIQLTKSIELEQQRRLNDTYLKSKVTEAKDAASLYLWDLEIRTRGVREIVPQIATEWKEEKKWDLLKDTFSFLIKNKAGTQSAYATASLAKDLLNGDLTKLPKALAGDESEESKALLRKMEGLSDSLGKSFYENLFDYKGKPLPGQKWVEKVLGRKGP